VPGEIKLVQLGWRHARRPDAEIRQDGLQVLAMQHVELHERPAAAAHLFHRRVIALAPGIGEGSRVGAARAMPQQERRGSARDTAPPIDDGAEYIEDQSADAMQCHRVDLGRDYSSSSGAGTY
jgi:hypothetical protein